jgi:cell division protein FtsI/penicillin-binding protein 2
MKKLLVLVAVFTTLLLSNANAQQGNGNFDPAQMAQRYKERVKPQLIEKAKLTDAQAEKVCDIQLASRQQMRALRDLSEEDRKKKMEEIQTDNNKQYKAIPLTDDQIKAVNDLMEEMRKQMQQQRQNGGGGNN